MVKLLKDLKKWLPTDQISEEPKYVIYKHNINAFAKACFGVLTAFPDVPSPVFSSPSSSQESQETHYSASSSLKSNSKPFLTDTFSPATQSEAENFDYKIDTQLKNSLWGTEFVVAEFEQQNKAFPMELSNLGSSLGCINRSRANAKVKADQAESKQDISERLISDLLE